MLLHVTGYVTVSCRVDNYNPTKWHYVTETCSGKDMGTNTDARTPSPYGKTGVYTIWGLHGWLRRCEPLPPKAWGAPSSRQMSRLSVEVPSIRTRQL